MGARLEAQIVVQHGGYDAGRAVGRCGHDLAAGGVFLVDRERKHVDPVERMHGAVRIAAHELAVELRGTATHAEYARQQALRFEAAAHAVLHDLPNAQQPRAQLGVGAPGSFACHHQLVDLQALLAAVLEQTHAGVEFERRRRPRGGRTGIRARLHDEAAADAVVLFVGEDRARCIVGREAHAVGMPRQHLIDMEQQIERLIEGDLATTRQADSPLAANSLERRFDERGIDPFGPRAFEPEQDRTVGAMPAPGQRERPVELRGDLRASLEQAARGQQLDEVARRVHRSHGVRLDGPMPILKMSKTLKLMQKSNTNWASIGPTPGTRARRELARPSLGAANHARPDVCRLRRHPLATSSRGAQIV